MFKKKWALYAEPVSNDPFAVSLAEACNSSGMRYRTKWWAQSAAVDMSAAYFGLVYVVAVERSCANQN